MLNFQKRNPEQGEIWLLALIFHLLPTQRVWRNDKVIMT